jgi:predicted nucleic acid-binding protein
MNVFVDTSALYAVLDRDDANNPEARVAWERLLRATPNLTTTNYVLLEVSALLQHRLGIEALRTFHEDIVPLLNIDWIAEQRHRAAIEAVLTAARKKLSVVDCVSFQTMREHGLRTVFCFDKHFREQGFETFP